MIDEMDQHPPVISTKSKVLLIALEVLLVLIIIVLLIATYMPAIIGGNPERQ